MEKSGLAVDSTNDDDDDDEKVKVRNQSHIHYDIAFSILSKLPIKSLKRFECVRKSWSLLFDNPNFMNMFRNNLLTKDHPFYHDASVLLHQRYPRTYKTFELYSVSGERFVNRFTLDCPNVNVEPQHLLGYGSVNGTLCFFSASRGNIILWNPSTKLFKLIPRSPYDFGPDDEVYVDLRGFGYDCVGDDYKVIRHVQYIDINVDSNLEQDVSHMDVPPLWEIYSLRTNSWRKLDVDMHHSSYYREDLYMDGLSHWLCDTDLEYDSDYTYLLSFDWSNEVFLTTLLPPEMDDDDDDSVEYSLLLLNGSIALSMNYGSTGTFHISILGELGVKESWTKIFTIGPFPCFDYPIGAGKKGDILFIKEEGEIVWFDLNTQMVEDCAIETSGFGCKILIHKKSLLPFEGANI